MKTFTAAREDRPGPAWLTRFRAGRAEAERWYLAGRRPPEHCRAALARHLPELLPRYDEACALVGDDPMAHRILSHWRPGPDAHGCTQLVWLEAGGPALLRNYDFPPEIVTGRIESTNWFGREVICTAQRPWGGCLDGMNADGLVASITHGGGAEQGEGFSIILVLRYLLETCTKVPEATRRLAGIPIAQSQNVTLLDRAGDHATIFLVPGRPALVTSDRVCANHQHAIPKSGNSLLRAATAAAALAEPLDALVARFLAPPLLSRDPRFTTVYTALYRPAEGSVTHIWPGHRWTQRLGAFTEGTYSAEL